MIDTTGEYKVYKTVRADAEFLVTVPGLFYDKDRKTLFIGNSYDSHYFIDAVAFNDQSLEIYDDDGICEYLYYKDGEKSYELWLNDIESIEVGEKQKKHFKFIDGVFCQLGDKTVYCLKYFGDKAKEEIVLDARKAEKEFMKIGCCCFSGTNIRKINIIENADRQIQFSRYCFKNIKGLEEMNVYIKHGDRRILGGFDYLGTNPDSTKLNIVTDIEGFLDRIKESGKLTKYAEIKVGFFADETGKVKRYIENEE